MANMLKTSILLAAMTALFMTVGYMLGGQTGLVIAFFAAAAMNLFSWWNSGSMVLRMHGATEVDEHTAPELVSMVRRLAQNAELPMPKVYVLETEQPNAFATGRNPENSAVAASAGLLDALTEDEVVAVMAHELAHIKSRDTLTMTITATLAGAIGMLSNFAFFFRGNRNNPLGFVGVMLAMIVAPMAASVVQMAISRTREYEADRDGAEICGDPLALASALEKIASLSGQTINEHAEDAPATAHLFIINPLTGKGMDSLFSTHPATENRIIALEALHEEWQLLDEPTNKPAPQIDETEHTMTKPQDDTWNRGGWRQSGGRQSGDDKGAQDQNSGPWGRSKKQTSKRRGPWS